MNHELAALALLPTGGAPTSACTDLKSIRTESTAPRSPVETRHGERVHRRSVSK
jgi:hypothetical protein